MNEQTSCAKREARWLTYIRGVAFVAPALGVLWFCAVFLFPKLRQIWQDSGFAEPVMTNTLAVTVWVLQEAVWLGVLLAGVLALLEWRWKAWPRYRKGLVEFGALALNSVILLVVTTMFMSALMAAPALKAVK